MERRLGPDDHRLARPLLLQGGLLFDLGEAEDALRTSERALALRERAPSPNREQRAMLLGNMAMAHVRAGRVAEACHIREPASLPFHRAPARPEERTP